MTRSASGPASDERFAERKQEDAFQAVERQVLELVTKGAPLDEVLTFLCRTIEHRTTPMLCSVMLVTDDGAHLSLAAGPNLPDEYNRLMRGIPIGPTVGSCGSATFFRKTTIVADIATDPLWKDYASVSLNYGLKACWSQPVLSSTGSLLGTFAMYYRETREPTPHDLWVVERASHIAAVAIEHAKVTEALSESEDRHRSVVSAMAEGIVIQDWNGRIRSCNASACRILGLTEGQVLGRTSLDPRWRAIHEDGSPFPGDTHPSMDTLRSGLPNDNVVMGVHRPDGSLVWISINTQPTAGGEGTQAVGVVASFRDITAQKQAEENLLRTQFAMDQAVDAVYWIDPQARILYTNEAASAMLGYTTDEFLRMTVHDLNPEFPPEVWPGWWEETREKKVVSLETVHVTKDGRRIPIDIRVSFLAYGGQEFQCAFVRDISSRKEMEEALDALVRGTGSVTGREFFPFFVKELAHALRVKCAGVADLSTERPGRARIQALWNGQDWIPPFEFMVAETPCGQVVRDGIGRYPSRVRELFPNDADLVALQAESYLGIRLCGHAGEPLGHLFVIDDKPMPDPKRAMAIMQIFATRAGAELDRLRIDEALARSQRELQTAHSELDRRVVERTEQLIAANESLQREIGERKRTEEAVRDSELRYKLLTEATFDGVAIHDHGILLEVNPGLERMFGYEPGELIGRSILDLVADESRDQVIANMRDGAIGPYEAIGRRKDGSIFHGEVVVRPCCYRGKEVRLVAGRDITERKHLELERLRYTRELERQVAERTAEITKLEVQRTRSERLAAVGQLAAGVAHEINNPIAGIKNAFVLVKQAIDPAHPHYEFVGMIDREIARVGAIVQNMYQLYQKEARRAEPVELHTLIRDLEAVFAKRISQRAVTFLVDIQPPEIRLSVPQGDLLQVLMNLLRNAIDSVRPGGTIRLTVDQEDGPVRIAVSDDGEGIPPDVLPHIFDPFFTTKSEGDQKGMGLGLAVSQSLVTAMGGTIEVETQPGRGSTFLILLPEKVNVICSEGRMTTMKEVLQHDE